MIELERVNTFYGLGHILHDLSLRVGESEVVALLGRNGAGKTTTLRSITGLTPPRAGRIRYQGRDISGLEPHQISRLGIALVPETRDIFSFLTVKENLSIAARKSSRWGVDSVLSRFPSLKQRLGNKGRELSGGEQQMLAIGRILRTGARLLLLDEPTEGLAPVIVQHIGRTLARLKQEGYTILLVEQNFRFAQTVADRHYVMEHGRVVDMIPNSGLEAAMPKLHAYLGV